MKQHVCCGAAEVVRVAAAGAKRAISSNAARQQRWPLAARAGSGRAPGSCARRRRAGRAVVGSVLSSGEPRRVRSSDDDREGGGGGSPVTVRRANRGCRGEDENGFGGRRRENGLLKPFRN
ncbi:hypothetical protein Syun_029425 [Stephania yunnanensis]|uniref:Uncharacterized protein n=1 Tax=Stephania yunnanensis TaxID=152371 RepID=A0AAP0HJU5_9MAGN